MNEAPRQNIPDNCSAGQGGGGRERKYAKPSRKGKKTRINTKHQSKTRTYLSESLVEEMNEIPLSSRRSVTGSEVPDNMANKISDSTQKSNGPKTPVPFHPDLPAKKVYSFLKKFLRRKGANFHIIMSNTGNLTPTTNFLRDLL